MKPIGAAEEPGCLAEWRAANPNESWEAFKAANGSLTQAGCSGQLYRALAAAQWHICAYCEIRLDPPLGAQVEHWHPKSDTTTTHNWGLDFANFTAACEGGVRADIPNGRCVTPIKDTQHCGAAKADYDWTAEILDPRVDVPRNLALWDVRDDGRIGVRPIADLPLRERAVKTIERLNLDSKALRPLRQALWEELSKDVVAAWVELGDPSDEAYGLARRRVAESRLGVVEGKLQPFWSTIRSYFDDVAEQWISEHPEVF